MQIEFDPEKRALALADRGLDFCDAGLIFDGPFLTQQDTRFAYPEPRFQTFGWLRGRMVMFAWTPVSEGRIRVFSMRKCNGKEQRRLAARLGR